jgi:hypothetical protein
MLIGIKRNTDKLLPITTDIFVRLTKVSPTVWTINKAINKDQRQLKRQSIEGNPATKARLSTLV